MAKRRVCATCGESFTATYCPNCTPPDVYALERIPGYAQCEFEYQGERCRFFGTIRHGTTGEGPKFCAAHFLDKTGKAAINAIVASRDFIPPTAADVEREALRKLKTGEGFLIDYKADGKASKSWAYAMKEREEKGQVLSEIQRRFWREALRYEGPVRRESEERAPGQDEEAVPA